MKDLDNLIESLNKKVAMFETQSINFKNKGERESSIYNEGVFKGIKKAIKEIEKANIDINIQINNLL